MGRHYCTHCSIELDMDAGDINGCDISGCQSGDFCCVRCGDEGAPSCAHCEEGCSMCPLIDENAFKSTKPGFDELFQCEHPGEDGGCPLVDCAADGDRCLSCYEELAASLGVDAYKPHKLVTFAECGHTVCEAEQAFRECTGDDCSVCVGEAEWAAKKVAQSTEKAACAKDRNLVAELLPRLKSQGARAALETWLRAHPADEGGGGASASKKQKTKK